VRTQRTLILVVAALCIGAALDFAYVKIGSFRFWSSKMGDVRSGSPEEILVMRTKGGLLEVSQIHATEVFDTKFAHTLLGIPLGETVPRIRVPVVYRYHIELAPEWSVLRTGDAFTVVAPPVKPSLPVAVDLGRMEKEASGTWVLLPFTERDALDDLEREITARLARKAVMPAYIQLQREHARQTVEEFVSKWLVTQAKWLSESRSEIRVYFADETIGSASPQALYRRATAQ
jgi:hypothetical protein